MTPKLTENCQSTPERPDILGSRRADLDEGARLLLAQETLTADQFPAIRSTVQPAKPAA